MKIVGFKSFVESTTLHFNSDRTAVVGPNGCGKSNVIDAIRWVMGESSPKFLRGDMMSDVIFNGSLQRKPLSLASVEILLDNTHQILQGAYVIKGDVALRREINRSGESTYYINGQRVRRKDLTDLWLGTGAGARGYAIIGQNMVNHLVEANPEVLRGYLEEAAGVSKYKERRKESAERLLQVEDNLSRIADIISELTGQLQRLETEAGDANQYHQLKQTLKQYQEQQQLARMRKLYEKNQFLNEKCIEQEKLEHLSQIQCDSLSAEVQKLEEAFSLQQESIQKQQQDLYQRQLSIQQQEQLYQQREQERAHYRQELIQLKQECLELEQQIGLEQQQIDELALNLSLIKQQTETVTLVVSDFRQHESDYKNQLKATHQARHEWRQKHQQHQTESQVLLAKLEQGKHNLAQLRTQIQKWQLLLKNQDVGQLEQKILQERAILGPKQDEVLVEEKKLAEMKLNYQTLQAQYDQLKQHMQETKKDYEEHSRQCMHAEAAYQGLLANIEGEKGVSSDKFNQPMKSIASWLKQWVVPHEWQGVIDWFWQHFLPGFIGECQFEGGIPNAYIATLLESKLSVQSNIQLPSLLSFMQLEDCPAGFLAWQHIYVAENNQIAFEQQNECQSHESIISLQGLWLGQGWWYALPLKNQKNQGLSTRLDLFKKAQAKKDQAFNVFRTIEIEYLEREKQFLEFKSDYEHRQRQYELFKSELNMALSQHRSLEQQLEMLRREQLRHQQELERSEQQYAEAVEQNQIWSLKLEQIQALITEEIKYEQGIQDKINHYQQELHRIERELSIQLQLLDGEKLKQTRLQTQYDFLILSIPKLNLRLTQIKERQQQIEQSTVLQQQMEPENGIEIFTKMREELKLQQADIDKNVQELKQFSQQRQTLVKDLESLKKQHLACLEKKWRLNSEKEQNILELDELKAEFSEDFSPQLWQNLDKTQDADYFKRLIDGVEQQLSLLGDVNLLAIGLFEQEKTRYQQILEQQNDLNLALSELQVAIQTLDSDMQTRLHETLLAINHQLLDIFPQLFGGGEAKFVASCDNLLEATVAVQVQLPGKKQHRIQLLSGGEKALTAVALLFAIFSLNPAPFCLLDEVDAALDDANVLRLADLIRNMSKTVQFILITHNPLTMDVAQELVGVTMQEPGVSRVVSVNMAAALAMVNKE